jgi:hypothetical protein
MAPRRRSLPPEHRPPTRSSPPGGPKPEIPSCEDALDTPTDRRCAAYEDALRDFLEDAREACNEPGHVRAEDFSCVPKSFFGGPRA